MFTGGSQFAFIGVIGGGGTGAAAFGEPDGPLPGRLDDVFEQLRQDPYQMELLISFGTSKGGSAGHLALAIRDPAADDDTVYSANFYADRSHEHERDHYTADLMVSMPKLEYLYGTRSSLGEKASFGLDYGEIYKRSVVGIRVRGVPAAQKQALAAFFSRGNDDYRRHASGTDYHGDETRYGYLDLNCAKTIGMGFKVGAGYDDLDVKDVNLLLGTRVVAALNANIPTEMAMKLMKAWHARGYAMEVVLYRKAPGSTYVDPHDEDAVAFKDLPDRFPSVLSRDFRKEQGRYEDFDNLYAMYLLYDMARYSVHIDAKTGLLEIARSKHPMAYAEAATLAADSAKADAEGFRRRKPFRTRGAAIGEPDAEELPQPAVEGRATQ